MRSHLLPACAVLFAAACAPGPAVYRQTPRPADPGWSGAPARPVPPPEVAPWDLAAELRGLRPAAPRGRSEHLGGDLEGEVLASTGSGYPLRGPSSMAPAGATLVERLFAQGSAQPSVYFVMVKRAPGYDPAGGDWEYLVVGGGGAVEERGKLALCARCHAEAPHDRLFGGGR